MNPIVKNILAVLAGAIGGAIVNMVFITIGPMIIPPPEGADTSTMEGLAESMKLFEPKHFVFPFIAHSAHAFVGAIIATKIAANRQLLMALIVGALTFLGGLKMVMDLPSPMWYNALDLIVAYFPMAYLGHKVAAKKS